MARNSETYGYGILESNSFKWPKKKPVKHVILTFEQTGDELRFQAVDVAGNDSASDVADMSSYAIGKIGTRVPPQGAPSPLDIAVDRQCWLLIQLDPAKNWQFTVGQTPCTLKEEDLKGKNVHLRHVFKNSKWGEIGPVSREKCRTMFFGVVQRGPVIGETKPNPGRCGINLNVEFFQDDGPITKKLKLIIDPDVPNDGGTTIP